MRQRIKNALEELVDIADMMDGLSLSGELESAASISDVEARAVRHELENAIDELEKGVEKMEAVQQ